MTRLLHISEVDMEGLAMESFLAGTPDKGDWVVYDEEECRYLGRFESGLEAQELVDSLNMLGVEF